MFGCVFPRCSRPLDNRRDLLGQLGYVAVTQLGLWGNYAGYHNESIQPLFSSAGTSYSSSTQTDDGTVSIQLTCADVSFSPRPAPALPPVGDFSPTEKATIQKLVVLITPEIAKAHVHADDRGPPQLAAISPALRPFIRQTQ